jgi:hypothetical protein
VTDYEAQIAAIGLLLGISIGIVIGGLFVGLAWWVS